MFKRFNKAIEREVKMGKMFHTRQGEKRREKEREGHIDR